VLRSLHLGCCTREGGAVRATSEAAAGSPRGRPATAKPRAPPRPAQLSPLAADEGGNNNTKKEPRAAPAPRDPATLMVKASTRRAAVTAAGAEGGASERERLNTTQSATSCGVGCGWRFRWVGGRVGGSGGQTELVMAARGRHLVWDGHNEALGVAQQRAHRLGAARRCYGGGGGSSNSSLRECTWGDCPLHVSGHPLPSAHHPLSTLFLGRPPTGPSRLHVFHDALQPLPRARNHDLLPHHEGAGQEDVHALGSVFVPAGAGVLLVRGGAADAGGPRLCARTLRLAAAAAAAHARAAEQQRSDNPPPST
jgi:hypothetical protein